MYYQLSCDVRIYAHKRPAEFSKLPSRFAFSAVIVIFLVSGTCMLWLLACISCVRVLSLGDPRLVIFKFKGRNHLVVALI